MTKDYSRPPTCPITVNQLHLLLLLAVQGHFVSFEDCENIAGILAASVDSRDVVVEEVDFVDRGENRLVEFVQGLGFSVRDLEDAEFGHG